MFMAATLNQWAAVLSSICLSVTGLHTAYHLFKDHRAPAVGMFLTGISAGLNTLPSSSPGLAHVQQDLEWAGQVLGPVLVSFGFLWLSEDRLTAHALLLCSLLLPALQAWLSPEGVALLSCCLALSSLSCSFTVSLFTSNVPGLVGIIALSLPALVAPGPAEGALASLLTPEAREGPLKWLFKISMVIGCLSTKRALCTYLLDLRKGE